MIDPAQMNAVREWIVAALSEALAAGEISESIPLERVVRSEQDAVGLAYPYATILMIGSAKVGTGAEQIALGDHGAAAVFTLTPISAVASIKITNAVADAAPDPRAEAYEFIAALLARLHSPVSGLLDEANMAIRDQNPQPTGRFLERGTQWVSRAGIDITFGVSRVVSNTPGTIETAEVTGTTIPPTPGDSPQIIG